MGFDTILVRYGEIALKGKNRHLFEKGLVENIKNCLDFHKVKYSEIQRSYGRIIIPTSEADKASFLKEVFGIVSVSPASKTDVDLENIKTLALELAKESGVGKKTFRISTQRLAKTIPFDSVETNLKVGEHVFESLDAKVDLKNPEVNVGIELMEDSAYIFTKAIQCFGGMPLGAESPVMVFLEDEKSIAAAWLMMKRGSPIIAVGQGTPDLALLNKYSHGHPVEFVQIRDLSEAENIAVERRIIALVLGQTMQTFKEFSTNLMVLRPLLTYSEEEIGSLLEKIK